MTAKICPKCGCVYQDGRSECTDCGEFTKPAALEEIAAFEKSSAKKLKNAAGTYPRKWQIVAVCVLVLFSAGLFLLWNMAQIPPIEPLALSIVNISLAIHLLIPNIDSWQMLFELITRKRTKLWFTYNYHRLFLQLIWVIAFNVLTLTVSMFRPDGLLIKLFTQS
ncbi:MAG: hypothetical protein J6O50_12195 [Ruminiclostridium sp.]|nr:hypothetical protein [Ruminiclostridium sp.]